MIKPNKQLEKAFNTLKYNEDFKVILDWLKESQDKNDEHLRQTPPETLGRYQGKAEVLSKLITLSSPRQ